ncbi:MAG TPA: transposase [Planctomycetota bacterium]|nr:transposase [Planctomycetota bacterium]
MDFDPETHRKRLKRFNVPGHAHFLTFSTHDRRPLLTNDLWRTWLANEIRTACDEQTVHLWAYVFMPEHVHLLVKPRKESYDIGLFLRQIKENFSKKIVGHLKDTNTSLLDKLRIRERPGKWCYRFWLEGGGYDGNVWSMKLAVEKARYCHWNPVKRRLVRSPELWRWSSFRWLEWNDHDNAPLRVDDWDETLIE